MGSSVDWLDIYRAHGAETVAGCIRAATAAPQPSPSPADTDSDADDPHYTPPPELVLPAQAGPRAGVVLDRLFNPRAAGEAWQLRRFGGEWYHYVPARMGLPRWKRCEDEDLRARVRQMLEGFWTRRWVERGQEWKYQRFAPTDRVVDDILKAAVHRLGVRSEQVPCWLDRDFDQAGAEVFDPDRWRKDHADDGPIAAEKVIAFRNGLFDVDAWVRGTPRLIPHSSRWFSMSTLDTDLPAGLLEEPDEELLAQKVSALCPSWIDFITEMSRGSEAWVEALQRFIGYCLTPDISLDKMLWVQGVPGTGKTTLVEAVEAVVGFENSAQTDLDALSGRFGVAPLVGKLVAVIPELHVGNLTNVAAALQRLKAISGGAAQQIDDKFMRTKSRVNMTCKFVITPNEEPRMPDASAAIVRRLVVLPVSHVPTRPDPSLGQRLEAERGGVRVWALLGLRRLWRDVAAGMQAFAQPDEGRDLLYEIEAKSSPARHFVRECCVVGEGNSVTVDALWAEWSRFREEMGYAEMNNKQTFGSQLRAAVPGLERKCVWVDGKRVYVYHGVRPRLDEWMDDVGQAVSGVRLDESYTGQGVVLWDDPRAPD